MSSTEPTPVQRFLRSSGIMAVFYAGSMLLAFVVGVVLTRSLGAYGFGIYSLALTTATLFGLATEFGLPVLALRETGTARTTGNWGALRGLLRWSDRAIAGLSIALIAATFVGVQLSGRAGESDYLATMLWAVALLPLVGLAKLRSNVLLALDRVAAAQFAVMIARPLAVLAVALGIIGYAGNLSASTAMIAQVAGATVSLLIVALLYRRWRPVEMAVTKPQSHVGLWLAASLPMGLSEGLRLLQGQLALLLTGWLAGAAAAGVYRGADAVVQLTTVVASVVATAATPMFARMVGEKDHGGIERIAILTSIAMAGGVLLIGLPIALAGEWIFPSLFGREFAASTPVFVVLWIGLFATYCSGLAQSLANMSGHHGLTTQSFLVTAALNLLLGLILIPKHGAFGAAFSTAVSASVGAAWCAWRLSRRTGYNTTVLNRSLPGQLVASTKAALAIVKARHKGA